MTILIVAGVIFVVFSILKRVKGGVFKTTDTSHFTSGKKVSGKIAKKHADEAWHIANRQENHRRGIHR